MTELKLYTPENRNTWNNFISECKNATFLHNRGYMEYHNHRFTDSSLMAYSNGKLIAVMPANRNGDILYSHQGLTYGGWLIKAKHFNAVNMIEIFDEMKRFLPSIGIRKLIYKPSPHIYHSYPAEEDLYALFRNNGTLIECNVSSTIPLDNAIEYNNTYRKAVNTALQNNISVIESESYERFWIILTRLLNTKYGVDPVHSLEEITLLKNRFPNNIRLFMAINTDGSPIAGTVIYDTGIVAHAQYITATDEGKANGALPLLFKHLIEKVFTERRYFDFGISNENHGEYLNEGLILQKSHMGGRAVVHNIYQLTF